VAVAFLAWLQDNIANKGMSKYIICFFIALQVFAKKGKASDSCKNIKIGFKDLTTITVRAGHLSFPLAF
jgi:hypothetical protein